MAEQTKIKSIRLEYAPTDSESNAIIYPSDPEQAREVYFTLIGAGPAALHDAIAARIVELWNAAAEHNAFPKG